MPHNTRVDEREERWLQAHNIPTIMKIIAVLVRMASSLPSLPVRFIAANVMTMVRIRGISSKKLCVNKIMRIEKFFFKRD